MFHATIECSFKKKKMYYELENDVYCNQQTGPLHFSPNMLHPMFFSIFPHFVAKRRKMRRKIRKNTKMLIPKHWLTAKSWYTTRGKVPEGDKTR